MSLLSSSLSPEWINRLTTRFYYNRLRLKYDWRNGFALVQIPHHTTPQKSNDTKTQANQFLFIRPLLWWVCAECTSGVKYCEEIGDHIKTRYRDYSTSFCLLEYQIENDTNTVFFIYFCFSANVCFHTCWRIWSLIRLFSS